MLYQHAASDGRRDTLFLGSARACAHGLAGFTRGGRLALPEAEQGMHEGVPIFFGEREILERGDPVIGVSLQELRPRQ